MSADERRSPHRLTQFNDYESSTLVCSCGASLTWTGGDDRVTPFKAAHGPEAPTQIITADGQRALAPPTPDPQ